MTKLNEAQIKKITETFYHVNHIIEEEDFKKHEVCSLVSCFYKTFDIPMLEYLQQLLADELLERYRKEQNEN